MAVKMTLLGSLIYAAMAADLLATGLLALRQRRGGMAAYGMGFLFAASAVAVRWMRVGHVPLQNLFEVFVALGVVAFPLSVLSRRGLRVGGEALDALVAFLLLFPAGFIFSEEVRALPPSLQTPLFGPHVGLYVTAYFVMTKAALQAVRVLVGRTEPAEPGLVGADEAADRMVRLGLPLLTGGLILGAVWGKTAWGRWWHWDPKEMWSLATWLVYGAYFHARPAFPRARRLRAALIVFGFALILVTLLWANLSRLFVGLHSYA